MNKNIFSISFLVTILGISLSLYFFDDISTSISRMSLGGVNFGLLEIAVAILAWLFVALIFVAVRPKGLGNILNESLFFVALLSLILLIIGKPFSPNQVIYIYLFTFMSIILGELISEFIQKRSSIKERTILIGYDHTAERFLNAIKRKIKNPENLVGIIDNNISKGTQVNGLPVLGKIIDMERIVKENNIEGVLQTGHFEQTFNLIVFARANALTYRALPIAPGAYSRNFKEELFDDVVTVKLEPTPLSGINLFLKRSLDIIGSLLLIVITLPLFLLIYIFLKVEDITAPVLVRERRYSGASGTIFNMLKFRTLPKGQEEDISNLKFEELTEKLKDIRGDKRATRIGKVLRRLYISELPQFFNVLLGDMSLVGPRPPYEQEVSHYSDSLKKRLLVKPGMTGLWQTKRKGSFSFEEMFDQDSFYVENWSLTLDFSILFKTIIKILKFKR